MIKKKEEMVEGYVYQGGIPIVIDLSGPDGNAYELMVIFRKLCKMFGMKYGNIVDGMMSNDYENLVRVVEEEFGEYVVMYR